MNLERVYAWLEGIPLAPTRSSQFEKMAHWKLATLNLIMPERVAILVQIGCANECNNKMTLMPLNDASIDRRSHDPSRRNF